VFQPLYQFGGYLATAESVALHVQAPDSGAALIPTIERQIRSIDPGLTVRSARTMADRLAASLRQERLLAFASLVFGSLALALCCVGLYGLAADAVSRRAHDIAVRIALGATRLNVVWTSMRETLLLITLGVAAGIPGAFIAARWLKSSLFGMTAAEPVWYAGVVFMLLSVGFVAAFIPARRAARTEPNRVLRVE
jgi:ABC-type antimicrobial peptide transport system permease subunit